MLSIACVIPTHNRPQSLHRALASVLEQTRPPTEVVVVDDMSSPETRVVISQFRTSIPIRLAQPDIPVDRRSASASRNYGARLTSSNYLAFLDDDDHWHPRFLEALVQVMEREHNSLACAWIGVKRDGRVVKVRRPRPSLRPEDILTSNPGLTGSNFVIARQAFEVVGGFDIDLPVSNDLDFLVRALAKGIEYQVVPLMLAYQTTDGRDHLSSRGARRVEGINKYREKYQHLLSRQDLRRLRRAQYVAMRYPEQRRLLRWLYFLRTVLASGREDWARWIAKLAGRTRSEYV